MEDYAIQSARWVENRVRQAEEKDPTLRTLKNRINELSEEISAAEEDTIPELVRKQDDVIQQLIARIEVS
jgi:uncharacterized protein involved in tolerance to divalent cations